MGDWKTVKKGNKTFAHPTSLADTPTKQPLSSSGIYYLLLLLLTFSFTVYLVSLTLFPTGSFGLLGVDELKQRKQTSQVDQIPATAPPPGTARNPSPLPNSNTKTKIFPGSTKTVLAEINGKESAQMKKVGWPLSKCVFQDSLLKP